MTESELLQEVVNELTPELINEPPFNADILNLKVKDAYRKVKKRRCYGNTSKTDSQIVDDLYNNFFQDIKDIALCNYSKIGGDFETSHSENGTSRVWMTEDEILGNIIAFVKIV